MQFQKGWIEVRGLAWSGRGKIVQVDISTDGGKTWAPAQLQDPVLDKAHTRFRYLWHWNGAETAIMSRTTDDTGYTQPTLKQLVNARGNDMGGYHLNPVTAWIVRRSGEVVLKLEKYK